VPPAGQGVTAEGVTAEGVTAEGVMAEGGGGELRRTARIEMPPTAAKPAPAPAPAAEGEAFSDLLSPPSGLTASRSVRATIGAPSGGSAAAAAAAEAAAAAVEAAASVQAATRGLLARLQAKWVAEEGVAGQGEESGRGLSPRPQSGGRLAPRVLLSPARSHLAQPSPAASAPAPADLAPRDADLAPRDADLAPRDRHELEKANGQADGPLFPSFFGSWWGASASASTAASASTSKLWAKMEAEEAKLQAG
jgi:hypothetical protein